MTKCDTYVGDINKVVEIFFIFDNRLQIFSQDTIWSRGKKVVVFIDSTFEFLIGEEFPHCG